MTQKKKTRHVNFDQVKIKGAMVLQRSYNLEGQKCYFRNKGIKIATFENLRDQKYILTFK